MSLWWIWPAWLVAGLLLAIGFGSGLRRARRDAERQRRADRIAEANARLARVPASPDNTEPTRLDWADHCELIWAASKEVDQP